MAFVRLFPINVTDAQDGDRTFSERLGLSDDAARNDCGACLHLLCSSSPLSPSPPAEKATARKEQARQSRTDEAWIDRTNDGLSGMPADGTSAAIKLWSFTLKFAFAHFNSEVS
jgi:hypothetical protein